MSPTIVKTNNTSEICSHRQLVVKEFRIDDSNVKKGNVGGGSLKDGSMLDQQQQDPSPTNKFKTGRVLKQMSNKKA